MSPVEIAANASETDFLRTHGKVVDFMPGDIIVHQGDVPHGIYLILEGTVTEEAYLSDEERVSIEILESGSVIGETTLIEHAHCGTTAVAYTPVKCIFLTRKMLDMMSLYIPIVKFRLMNRIASQVCQRIKSLHDNIGAYSGWPETAPISFFSSLVDFLATPEPTTLEKIGTSQNYLENLPVFSQFQPEEVDEIINRSELLHVQKNCCLASVNDKRRIFFLVIQGGIRSSMVYGKRVAKLSVIGPNAVFATPSCIEKNADFSISFVSCERATLLRLDEEDLEFFRNTMPETWYKIFDLICRSLVTLEKSINKLYIRLKIEDYQK